jgi:site-specific DNA-methyltransferase (adenine-specific)
VSSRKPFGIPTNYEPRSSGIPCWFIQRIGLKYASKSDVDNSHGYLDKWKLLIPKAPIAGQTDFSKPVGFYYDGNTRIAKPGECCTESWIVAGAFTTKKETLSYKSYLFTKIARFLLLQTVVSQDVTRKNFCFVPDLKTYTGTYSDEELCAKWGISDEEWKYINSRIGEIKGE